MTNWVRVRFLDTGFRQYDGFGIEQLPEPGQSLPSVRHPQRGTGVSSRTGDWAAWQIRAYCVRNCGAISPTCSEGGRLLRVTCIRPWGCKLPSATPISRRNASGPSGSTAEGSRSAR